METPLDHRARKEALLNQQQHFLFYQFFYQRIRLSFICHHFIPFAVFSTNKSLDLGARQEGDFPVLDYYTVVCFCF